MFLFIVIFKIVFFFCFISSEENVYKLCQDVQQKHPNEINKCFVVFVSNSSRTVPLWRQRAGKDEDKLVIWVKYSFQIKFNLKNAFFRTIM